ncbi:MAG: hypothetical protein AB7O96_06580 [Pseudobdellovibrionaceae bacterium]
MRWMMLLLLILAGCASTELKAPQSRFNLPESMGGSWDDSIWSVETGLSSNVTIEPVKDPSARPVDLKAEPFISSDTAMLVRTDVSFSNWLDSYLRIGNDSEPTQVGVKMQILGKPLSESQEGDMSLAFTAGYGKNSSKSEGTKNGEESGAGGADDFPWKARSEIEFADLSLVFGYRLNSDTLIYLGPFSTFYRYNLYIDHGTSKTSQNDPAIDSAAKYQDNGAGKSYGGHIGANIRVTTNSYLTFEWNLFRTSFEEKENSWSFVAGSMGTRF